MKQLLGRKCVVFGIIALFVALAVTPAISALDTTVFKERIETLEETQANLLEIEASEYKSDGSIEKKTFALTQSEIDELESKLVYAKKIEERVQILKDYGLVSQETTLKDWETGMQQKATHLGLTCNTVQKINPFRLRLPILLTFLSSVNAVYFMGNSVRFGLSPIIRLINLITRLNLKGVDLVDVCWGSVGVLNTKRLFTSHSFVSMPGFMGMVGFVGVSLKFPMTMHIFTGYAALTFAFGLGIHTKDWGPAKT